MKKHLCRGTMLFVALSLGCALSQAALAASQSQNTANTRPAASVDAEQGGGQKTNAPASINRAALAGTSLRAYDGARAFNASGKPVGHVDGVIVDDMDSVAVILNQGGVLDSGRRTVRKPISEVEIARDEDGDVEIRLDMLGDDIATIGAQISEDPALAASERMASALLGTAVSIAGTARSVTLDDLIVDDDGRIRFAVLGVDQGVLGLREHAIVVDPESLNLTDSEGLRLTLGERAFRAAPRLVSGGDR